MLRFTIWLIALAAIGIGLAIFSAENSGMVSIFWHGKRIDLSLNLALLTLAACLLIGYFVLRLVGLLSNLPEQAHDYRQEQHQSEFYSLLLRSMTELGAGRFVRAQKSALQSLEHVRLLDSAEQKFMLQARAVAHYLVADSAHRLSKTDEREQHYQLGLALAERARHENTSVTFKLRKAYWLVQDTEAQNALQHLRALPKGAQRRLIALRLKLKASRLSRNHKEALETARLLNKHGAFSKSVGHTLVQSIAKDYLASQYDLEQMKKAWGNLHDSERNTPEIAAFAGQHILTALTTPDTGDASSLKQQSDNAKQWLAPMWKRYSELSPTLQWQLVQNTIGGLETIDNHWLRTIEQMQSANRQDIKISYLAGVAYLKRQLWGKAQQMFESNVHSPLRHPNTPTHIIREVQHGSWRYLALLAQRKGDVETANHAWNQACDETLPDA